MYITIQPQKMFPTIILLFPHDNHPEKLSPVAFRARSAIACSKPAVSSLRLYVHPKAGGEVETEPGKHSRAMALLSKMRIVAR